MVEKSNNDDWSKMLGRLLTFKREHGHWNVTEDWPENQDLVQWIQIQREKKTNGQLPPERVEELEKLGFPGSIEERTLPSEDTAEKHPPIFDEGSAYEKLYFIGVGKYVQYGGNGEKPQELLDYADRHNGEFPPHIPLPNRPVEFEIFGGSNRIRWSGRGPLPEQVLAYVKENGFLPRNTSDME